MRDLYYASQQSAQNTVLLLKQALSEKKKKKRYRELAALVASGRKLGSWGWAWERDFSKGKDFQREKIFKVFTFLYLQTLELCCSYLNKI